MIGRRLLVGCIELYRLIISPILPPACRFTPSCSEYAQQAIARYGVGKGVLLAGGRVLRCHPWNAGGVDPVPLPRKGSSLCP